MREEAHETERELQRVVDRLNSMPLTKAAVAGPAVEECAVALVAAGRSLGVPIPADAELPSLAPQGFGSLIAVLGRDCLEAAGEQGDLTTVHAALVSLRHALP